MDGARLGSEVNKGGEKGRGERKRGGRGGKRRD